MRTVTGLAMLTLLAGCGERGEAIGSQTPQDSPVHVNRGATFELRMHANESTGYHWALAEPLDSTRLADLGHRYIPSDPSGRRAGAGGMEVWRFEALDTGQTQVAVHFRRGAGVPAEQRRYTVVIR